MHQDPDTKLIDHALISPGENARQFFDPGPLAALKESIRQYGVLQNIRLIEDEKNPGRYLLCGGERRWRATGQLLEELATQGEAGQELLNARRLMPAKILPAHEGARAYEEGLVENLQREDITPLEEADAYHSLTLRVNPETGGVYTHEEIARKVGRLTGEGEPDVACIRRRLKLRNAPEELLNKVNEKAIPASIAELVGRVPDADARRELAREIMNPKTQDGALNVKQVKELIQERYMMSLRRCGFDVTDWALVEAVHDEGGVRLYGGACADCPQRSENNPTLEEDLSVGRKDGKRGIKAGISPDLCLRPSCFRAKQDESWRIARRTYEQQGLKVIDGDAARKLFSGPDGELAYDAAYAGMKDTPEGNLVHWQAAGTWEELMEQHGAVVPYVMARNPHTKQVHQLIEIREAIAIIKQAAEKKGERTPFHRPLPSSGNGPEGAGEGAGSGEGAGGGLSAGEQEKAAKEKAKLETAVAHEAARELLNRIGKRGVGIEEQMLIFQTMLGLAGGDGQLFLGKMLGLKVAGSTTGRDYGALILAHVKAQERTKQELEGWTVVAMLAKGMRWTGAQGDDFLDLAAVYGMDMDALRERVGILKGQGQRPEAGDGRSEMGDGEEREGEVRSEEGEEEGDEHVQGVEEAQGDFALQVEDVAVPVVVGVKGKKAKKAAKKGKAVKKAKVAKAAKGKKQLRS